MSASQEEGSKTEDEPNAARIDGLIDLLTRYWHLDGNETQVSTRDIQKNWTVSEVAEHYLRFQLRCQSDSQQLQDGGSSSTIASLASMAVGKISEMLSTTDDLQTDIGTIAKNLSPATLRQILGDGRLPYVVLRAFLDPSTRHGMKGQTPTPNKLQDIDEAILLNERYLRSCGSQKFRLEAHLVTLENFVNMIKQRPESTDITVIVKRKVPPLGGFEFLGETRQQTIKILPNSGRYLETFCRITGDILLGLDWANVVVAGDLALATLMCTSGSDDKDEALQSHRIKIHLWGLDTKAANRKIEDIYDVWRRNLPTGGQEALVVKSPTAISFIAGYPTRRIEVLLRLFDTPMQVLLSTTIDPLAIGFDGVRVIMLPRCARAIETGYSVLTADMLYNVDWRADRDEGLYRYAYHGFGLRILPSYAKSLEKEARSHDGEVRWAKTLEDNVAQGDVHVRTSLNLTSRYPKPYGSYGGRDSYRSPQGREPGLKTLKRVAYLGQDYTNRFLFQNTPLDQPSDGLRASRSLWIEDYQDRRWFTQTRIEASERQKAKGRVGLCNHSLEELDHFRELWNDTYGIQALGAFELHMRNAEAWRLGVTEEGLIDLMEICSSTHEARGYNEFTEYFWNVSFKGTELTSAVERCNNDLFDNLKYAICEKLGIPYQRTGYGGYLTRRIRLQVTGPDLRSVLRKQITLPLMIPSLLENFILEELPRICPDLPSHLLSNPFLIPVHDPSSWSGNATSVLPSLTDRFSESGNLRYLVITNESMWAGQHRIMDEVFALLFSLHRLIPVLLEQHLDFDCKQPEAVWHVANSIRRRAAGQNLSTSKKTRSGLSEREATLFRSWILAVPDCAEPAAFWGLDENGNHRVDFEEDGIMYPFPDELFWKDGDEGEWDGEDVPQWRDVPSQNGMGKGLASRKRKVEDTNEDAAIDVDND